ncbi:hypothetical protein [Pelagibacterium lacus]|uniref:Uncharacterized protein n=1 Tax=Pelagibacterium lacus TaxID=2282655 RepID=A0A369W9H5_9HYPH|nr:hypothetical protein [Pelagibacterium lacus]RDE10515.1 hypothetical protein DVH29_00760 [Pelagibacterium lacus]
MAEFEYRGYRIRMVFERDWRIKIWPPVRPAQIADKIRATPNEGEALCRQRATRAIDRHLSGRDHPARS